MDPAVQEYFKGKRLLITGASGYLANNLEKSLKNVPCTLFRLTRKSTLSPLDGVVDVEDIQGDISDISIWDRAMQEVDIVFHFAGQTSVYLADKDPESDYRANVLPMLHMLETCKKIKSRPDILFAGTSTQVGIPESLPVNEACADKPITVYDVHKWMAETYLKCYARLGFVRGTSLRLTNVYGPGPKSSSGDRGILNTMARRALSGKNLTLYGEGKNIRDYIFVDDAISAFLLASANMEALNEKHFVLGSGKGHSISDALNQVAEQVASKTGKQIAVESIDPPSGLSPIEERCFVADAQSFSELTGWQPNFTLSEGIEKTLDAFLR